MAQDDDTAFRPRVGRIRSKGGAARGRADFLAAVRTQVRRQSPSPAKRGGSGSSGGNGRRSSSGSGASSCARSASRSASYRGVGRGRGASFVRARGIVGWRHQVSGARRVTVKARVARQAGKGGGAAAHLRYIQRDGTSRDGERGVLYGPETDHTDAKAFLERGADDRHQFRFIVSPEDAERMDDLTDFTRDLMTQMEADLGTRLDWVAVNHFNTAHPHVHVVVNGRDDQGKDLVIDGSYITHGLRERASEFVTLELGPVSEIEQRQKLESEIDRDRFTRIDRALLAQARDGSLDMRPGIETPASDLVDRRLRLSRLAKLERMGLANQTAPGRWTLEERLEERLGNLGERDDITKQMHRALKARDNGTAPTRDPGHFRFHSEAPERPVAGRLVDRHLTDELGENLSLVVDGLDGRVHHLRGFDPAQMEDIPAGAIVEIAAAPVPDKPRPSDRAILAHTENGIYRPSAHLEQMQLDRWSLKGTPEDLIKGYVRRLEALRRAGIVERLEADRWRIPEDFQQKVLAYDAARAPKATVRLLSAFDLEAQIGSDGATWLDRRLVAGAGRDGDRVEAGFGGEVGDALARRQKALIDRGDASLTPEGMVRYRKNLLVTLEGREVERVGQAMAEKREKLWRPLDRFETIQGTMKGPIDLASGRFAVLESGHEFSLVPWRPEIGRQRQKEMAISMDEHGGISWELGRGRGLGL
ncbi:relaxase/mobilization nuclease domain-containing protein [Nguyenibacter vanlangensis]|uniref:relaxase/mobilization nuclease domain-containing protein n=1 Tax=Nguyenibacter vanlangensis TaxID=1216886 RepID=UPI0038D13B71